MRVCVCVRACARACVRACARVFECVRACTRPQCVRACTCANRRQALSAGTPRAPPAAPGLPLPFPSPHLAPLEVEYSEVSAAVPHGGVRRAVLALAAAQLRLKPRGVPHAPAAAELFDGGDVELASIRSHAAARQWACHCGMPTNARARQSMAGLGPVAWTRRAPTCGAAREPCAASLPTLRPQSCAARLTRPSGLTTFACWTTTFSAGAGLCACGDLGQPAASLRPPCAIRAHPVGLEALERSAELVHGRACRAARRSGATCDDAVFECDNATEQAAAGGVPARVAEQSSSRALASAHPPGAGAWGVFGRCAARRPRARRALAPFGPLLHAPPRPHRGRASLNLEARLVGGARCTQSRRWNGTRYQHRAVAPCWRILPPLRPGLLNRKRDRGWYRTRPTHT
jgi:hypothetical protein